MKTVLKLKIQLRQNFKNLSILCFDKVKYQYCCTEIIFYLCPNLSFRVCELLQGGAIMNKSYQPHEAHIPYLLQLFIDYNLYGMNLINLAAVKFRKARRKSKVFIS